MKFGPHTLQPEDGVILDVRLANYGIGGEKMDVSRTLAQSGHQLSFGYGAHKCLGFAFGQLQAELILERLLLTTGGNPDMSRIKLAAFKMESCGSFREVVQLEVVY